MEVDNFASVSKFWGRSNEALSQTREVVKRRRMHGIFLEEVAISHMLFASS
jgi:hypothetical protein